MLLRALLAAWNDTLPLAVFLDSRARKLLELPMGTKVFWVNASVSSRLKAEFRLRKMVRARDTLLCFHNLPPLLPSVARVVVFQQNRILLGNNSLFQFAWKARLRITCERFINHMFRHRVSEYIVQTPTMQRDLLQWYSAAGRSRAPTVNVLPFFDTIAGANVPGEFSHEWDFIYVADGEAHKNHRVLLEAWRLLAQEGLYPSLALTLTSRDDPLKLEVEAARAKVGLNIFNLGKLHRERVIELYKRTRAMIFPSTSESFGLPLIEATQLGVPILAPELDYVRDVCSPMHTFDPSSAISVARAVKRFLGCPEPVLSLRAPEEFWCELLQQNISV
ncbi:glycosyltransferase [Microbulbifer variabilis]|uniref:glycosyltransferase n=1 Tax=Microbulbifer variabilis TaxID=266805 RepID=UPI00036DB925|nr:glycosyltransferase [Microbulbifer variabilis]